MVVVKLDFGGRGQGDNGSSGKFESTRPRVGADGRKNLRAMFGTHACADKVGPQRARDSGTSLVQ